MRSLAVLFGLALAAVASPLSNAGAAEPADEVLDKWVSTDNKAQPMEFLKDGKFKFGWTRDKGKWEMADGTYTVDKDGKIKARAMSGGAGLTLEFTLEKGAVTGTVGGKNYTFKKEEAKKDK